MSTHADTAADNGQLMALGFPVIGPLMALAYRELHIAATGTKEQLEKLGNIAELQRPWEPGSCTVPELRAELWGWLDEVAAWLNSEYTWDVVQLIPACWPHHPHIVHDLATVADQRRRAGAGLTSDGLEEWHRYALPAFLERMRGRLRDHCDTEHRAWPGRGRHVRYLSDTEEHIRNGVMSRDIVAALATTHQSRDEHDLAPARLRIVDLTTGEVSGDPQDDTDR